MTVRARDRRLRRAAALLLLSLGVAACDAGQNDGSDSGGGTAAGYSSSLSVNGITLRGSRLGASDIRDGRLRTEIGGHAVTLEDFRLRVDGVDYGHLEAGDTVTVTDTGAVLLNGQPAGKQ